MTRRHRLQKVIRDTFRSNKPEARKYSFVFSDDIKKWMESGNISSKEFKNAKPLF